MSDQDPDSKTEEPTGKRLEEARNKGQVITSKDVGNLIILAAAGLVVLLAIPNMARDITNSTRRYIEMPHLMRLDDGGMHNLMVQLALDVAIIMAPALIIMIVAAILTGVVQHGWLIATESLTPKLEKISPVAGFKRPFSLRQMIELPKGILKIIVVGVITYFIVWPEIQVIDRHVNADIMDMLAFLFSITLKIMLGVVVVMLIIAVGDWYYQRYEFMKNMRMTKQEVKDEYKQSEGDPLIKGRLRQIRASRARKRMMAQVPTATVVITNPTHFAVALKYDQTMAAPVLVAKGGDLVAKRIRDMARENFVPIVENPPLARTLFAAVEVDQQIPHEHYKAVAEVIGFVMRLKRHAVH